MATKLKWMRMENGTTKGGYSKMSENKPEFNNGFVLALALFYQHSKGELNSSVNTSRIYAASDHLQDIEIPMQLSETLKQKMQRFLNKVFKIRLEKNTYEEEEKLFEESLNLLSLIDKEVFKINAEWSYP